MQVPLRIAHFSGEDDAIPFDRRHDRRRRLEGDAVAVFSTPDGARRLTPIELRDLGGGGIGFTAEIDAPVGANCSVYERPSPHTPQRLQRLATPVFHGCVVRCDAGDDGFSVGVGLSRVAAA